MWAVVWAHLERFQVCDGPGMVWLADDAIWVTVLEGKDEG
jgi:hypothetical protein